MLALILQHYLPFSHAGIATTGVGKKHRPLVGVFVYEPWKSRAGKVKTRIYIDGYNFYYGCLKHTPYKWLDLEHLFRGYILPRLERENSDINSSPVIHPSDGIRFYTAEINPKAAQDPNSLNDQRSYHAALTNYRRSKDVENTVKIIKGNYAVDKVNSRKVELMSDSKEKEPRYCSTVKVWKFEEKQSDVNIAVDALFDVMLDHTIEHVVFVTNDTDIAPALKKIRLLNDLSIRPHISISLVVPARKENNKYRTNKTLRDLADWTIDYIENHELASSQLPCRVANGKKSALRPVSWFEHKEKVGEILELLCDQQVLGSLPRAWRWLSTPKKPDVSGLPTLNDDPSTMLHDLEGIAAVYQHACAYAEFMKKIKE